jgi:diguanylate cyclase (GGDEF)-like protein
MTKPETMPPGSRVMVVDDSAGIRRLLSARLRRAGHEVVEAASGREALRVYQNEPSEVVITDVSMPGLGGLELLAELRAVTAPPEVILLTGVRADDAQAAVQALRLGAHDYIPKAPAALEAVVLAVERALEKWRLREENERLVRELRSLSLTDGLTGLGNRRAFDEAVRREVARARRFEQPLTLALLDLDHFKHVNDTLGHDMGDRVLSSFAGRMRAVARLSDALFRYGGEEFVAILFGTPLGGGVRFAERLRAATAARPLAVGGHRVAVTVSIGVAQLEPADDESGLTVFTRADAALYKAKDAGRNRVRTEGEEVIALPAPSLAAAGSQARRPAC